MRGASSIIHRPKLTFLALSMGTGSSVIFSMAPYGYIFFFTATFLIIIGITLHAHNTYQSILSYITMLGTMLSLLLASRYLWTVASLYVSAQNSTDFLYPELTQGLQTVSSPAKALPPNGVPYRRPSFDDERPVRQPLLSPIGGETTPHPE